MVLPAAAVALAPATASLGAVNGRISKRLTQFLLLWALALSLATVATATASAAGLSGTRESLARDLRGASSGTGAVAVDLDTGDVLVNAGGRRRLVPASVNKLYTTSTLLRRFGPGARLATRVLADDYIDATGTMPGNLYLRGAGDPTFGSQQAKLLARALADAGLTTIDGAVVGDESAFDALRGPPSEGFRTSRWVGPLSALTYDRGRLAGSWRFQAKPPLFAAQRFEALLRRQGVHVSRPARAGSAPADAIELTRLNSPTMAQLSTITNVPSDNYSAEILLKALGESFGGSGSTAAGASVVRSSAEEFGINPQVVDGSGLSRSNRTSAREVVTLLSAMADSGESAAFKHSLALAGRTGTIGKRMRSTVAAGRCRAKTGTLIGVSTLAGYCTTTSGSRVAFAFLMNGINVYRARLLQDRLTATLAAYSPKRRLSVAAAR